MARSWPSSQQGGFGNRDSRRRSTRTSRRSPARRQGSAMKRAAEKMESRRFSTGPGPRIALGVGGLPARPGSRSTAGSRARRRWRCTIAEAQRSWNRAFVAPRCARSRLRKKLAAHRRVSVSQHDTGSGLGSSTRCALERACLVVDAVALVPRARDRGEMAQSVGMRRA